MYCKKTTQVPAYLVFITSLIFIACQHQAASTKLQQDSTAPSKLFQVGTPVANINLSALDEASGLVNSRSNPNYLWAHNDSGGEPVLFLIDHKGDEKGRFRLKDAENIDWEDMAIGLGPNNDQHYLYAADIGDNQARRSSLSIYRVPEPDLSAIDQGLEQEDLMSVDKIDFVYEDGPRDAEVLLADPLTRNLYIVTKREEHVRLYRLAYPQETTRMDTAVWVSDLPFTYITAGDISLDGEEVLIKNYLNIYYWKKATNESLEDLLKKQPKKLAYQPEPQGEAIAWKTDGTGFYTLSEKADSEYTILFEYRRN